MRLGRFLSSLANNINIIKKINSSEKDEKIKEEKYICYLHNKKHFLAYCHSCKKIFVKNQDVVEFEQPLFLIGD